MGLSKEHLMLLIKGITWRKARDDGAMLALVKRHEVEQVRQVGASDPEQSECDMLVTFLYHFCDIFVSLS